MHLLGQSAGDGEREACCQSTAIFSFGQGLRQQLVRTGDVMSLLQHGRLVVRNYQRLVLFPFHIASYMEAMIV